MNKFFTKNILLGLAVLGTFSKVFAPVDAGAGLELLDGVITEFNTDNKKYSNKLLYRTIETTTEALDSITRERSWLERYVLAVRDAGEVFEQLIANLKKFSINGKQFPNDAENGISSNFNQFNKFGKDIFAELKKDLTIERSGDIELVSKDFKKTLPVIETSLSEEALTAEIKSILIDQTSTEISTLKDLIKEFDNATITDPWLNTIKGLGNQQITNLFQGLKKTFEGQGSFKSIGNDLLTSNAKGLPFLKIPAVQNTPATPAQNTGLTQQTQNLPGAARSVVPTTGATTTTAGSIQPRPASNNTARQGTRTPSGTAVRR